MHVTFISLCKGKAIKKTRAILDRYAQRNGVNTWLTPITKEALDSVYDALKKQTTKNTAIACYRNYGASKMSLAWTLGRSDAFNDDGIISVHYRKKPEIIPDWLRHIQHISAISGFSHDFGKASIHFQNKLRSSKIIADFTRHEWISAQLLNYMFKHENIKKGDSKDKIWAVWERAWNFIRNMNEKEFHSFPNGNKFGILTNIDESVIFNVLTHHGLLDPKNGNLTQPNSKGHTDRELNLDGEQNKSLIEYLSLSKRWKDEEKKEMVHALRKIFLIKNKIINNKYDKDAWKAISYISRASLILADHEVSSMKIANHPSAFKESLDVQISKKMIDGVFANTNRDDLLNSLNQNLPWHLTKVAEHSFLYTAKFFNHQLPGINKKTKHKLINEGVPLKFKWQQKATNKLKHITDEMNEGGQKNNPTLVFNLASTGAGKTRMNIKAVAALTPENKQMRFVAGFNLKTLTLQTRDAFKEQVGVKEKDLSCMIGDRLTVGLHNHPMFKDDENLEPEEGGQSDFEYDVEGPNRKDYPAWLETLSTKKRNLKNLIGSPGLVATIDYITHAGEPGKQGHHGHALLRISNSDLILDEVDSYDPIGLVALLRVIWSSGVFGKNVIISSATLPIETARAIYEAYNSGVISGSKMRRENVKPNIVCIDNTEDPFKLMEEDNFDKFYNEFLNKKIEELDLNEKNGEIFKRGFVKSIDIESVNNENVIDVVINNIMESSSIMHDKHSFEILDKKVSFGLVRVANVPTCISIAKKMIENSEKTHITYYVCPYHAIDLNIRRKYKESKLDQLLERKDGWMDKLTGDRDLTEKIKKSNNDNIIFMVIATPVEEVGRDHDFDWAIIEPSSIGSIIQTAGRVNRHRLKKIKPENENIHVLQYNIKALLGKSVAFQNPGFEKKPYSTHNLIDLLGGKNLCIDTRLRFGDNKCLFSQKDDSSIQDEIKTPMKIIKGLGGYDRIWTVKAYYKKYPLRDSELKKIYRISDENGYNVLEKQQLVNYGIKWSQTPEGENLIIDDYLEDSEYWWLSPKIQELRPMIEQIPINMRDLAMQFEVGEFVSEQPMFHSRAGGYQSY